MRADAAVLEAGAVNAWRGDRHILRDVSLAVRAGEVLVVTGANGVGKTTLLRVLCGLLPPESGEVRWRNRAIGTNGAGVRDELAYLGHANALKADLTARENLLFLAGLRRRLSPADIDAALERVGIAPCADLPARSLSAGQRRRLTLARLWLSNAVLWILDEPVTNLDADGIELAQSLLRQHAASGGLAVTAAHQRLLDGDQCVQRLELH